MHRTILVLDVEGFGDRRRTNPHQVAVREGLYLALRQAFDKADLAWADCDREDRGDGVFILAPADMPKGPFVEALPLKLVEAVRHHNEAHRAEERIRLRMALHAGEVTYDEHGVTARSINLTFRLLEASVLKAALAESSGVLAVITSAWFFDEVVRHSAAIDPATFRPVRVVVKETSTVGWICRPDHPYPSDVTQLTAMPHDPTGLVPRQLPAPPRMFTGRSGDLAAITAALNDATAESATMMISAIGGMGGIGKTWLALRWAHQYADRFPDGQLFVNLRGFDPIGEPMPPAVAIRGFLDALGADPTAIPIGVDAQAALFRSLVANKHMLILLDNARDTTQIAPLLPGSPSCTVLVTSRHQLAGLLTDHGAHQLDLDVLTELEAKDLLACYLGSDQVVAESKAADEVVEYCAGLPLAISIVAARLCTRPGLTIGHVANRLRDRHRRLTELSVGERGVAAAFALSCQHLNSEQQRMFRLLGLHPGPDIDVNAAASLAKVELDTAERLLEDLVDVRLLQQPTPGRYRLHDLLRQHAHNAARSADAEADHHDALTRLVDFYLHTAFTADRLLDPYADSIELGKPAAGCRLQRIPDQAAALSWFSDEYPNLLSIHHHAVERGWHARVWQLAWVLRTFQYWRGHFPEAIMMWQVGLTATQQAGDLAIQALAHRILGLAHQGVGHHDDALRHLHHALALATQTGDLPSQAHTHRGLAWSWNLQGHDQRALDHALRALRLFETLNRPLLEALTLDEVGKYQTRLGDQEQARTHCEAALALFRRHSCREGEAFALDSLGYIAYHTGRYIDALDYYQQSLTLFHAIGHIPCESRSVDHLGETYAALNEVKHARTAWQQAYELYQTQHRKADAERIQQQLATLNNIHL